MSIACEYRLRTVLYLVCYTLDVAMLRPLARAQSTHGMVRIRKRSVMNIKIDIELTPQELRQFIGLPDVAGLQDDMIQFVREKVTKGADNIDVDALRQTIQSTRAWKRFMALIGPVEPEVTVKRSPRKRKSRSKAARTSAAHTTGDNSSSDTSRSDSEG